MENLNAEQVKKALECCLSTSASDCIACTYRGKKDGLFITCTNRLMADALALINSQEQRIKELGEENERLSKEVADLKDELKCEKETNAHLSSQYMSENHLRHQVEEMLANGMSVVKADTVRKMQERVLQLFPCDKKFTTISRFTIDQIAKEMLEGEK